MKNTKSPAEIVLFNGLRVIEKITKVTRFGHSPKSQSAIFCYHSVSNDNWRFSTPVNEFEQQIRIIQQHYRIVPLSKLLSHTGNEPLAAITFDDGYASIFDNALPILKKLDLSATVFVIGDRKKARRSELDNALPLLSTGQIKKLRASSWEIGFHTTTHAYLKGVSNEVLIEEVAKGKKEMEKILGTKIDYFAYPRGGYDKRVVNFVSKAGFDWAFTVDGGGVRFYDKYKITRMPIEGRMNQVEFLALLSPLGTVFYHWFLISLRYKALIKL